MATPTETPSKTSFVKDFLNGSPQGTFKTVNEAWTAAGGEGTISKSVVDKTRAKLGLTGNLGRQANKTAKQKATPTTPKTTTTTPGKTSFVKQFLKDHPTANSRAVNEAWTAGGMQGTISRTLVNKTRIKLTGKGLGKARTPAPKKTRAPVAVTGNSRVKPTVTGLKPTKVTPINRKPAGQPPGTKTDRTNGLLEVETAIDRLIFTVMGIGNLSDVETALREARRAVYRAMSS
jgi:hypothetical protein